MKSSFILLALGAQMKATVVAAQVVLPFDQPTRSFRASDTSARGMARAIDAENIRIKREATVRIRVVRTNTALYRFSIDDAPGPQPETLAPISPFLPLLKGYLPELGLLVHGRTRGGRVSLLPDQASAAVNAQNMEAANLALANASALEADLRRFDQVLSRIDGTQDLTLRTLDRMRRGNIEAQANALADSLGVPRQSCVDTSADADPGTGTALSSTFLLTTQAVKLDAAALAGSLADSGLARDPGFTDTRRSAVLLQTRADSALRNSQPLSDAATRVERLADRVLRACSTWNSPEISMSSGASRTVTVKIELQPETELHRFAGAAPAPTRVTLLPPLPRVTPAISLSALYTPQAQYKTYGVRATGGTPPGNEVYEATSVDNRFSYGVTAGLALHPSWQWPTVHDVSVWLPTLTVAEAGSKQTAFGFGTALSIGRLTLGTGRLFVRHSILDSLVVGQRVANDKFLKTRDTYGRSHPYYSISFDLSGILGGDDNKKKAEEKPAAAPPSAPRR